MEFLPVATAVYALAKGISDWLNERAEKDATAKKISAIASQIQNVLHPFQSMREVDHVERPLFDSVASVGDTLKRTQEHLLIWEYKRSRKVIAFFKFLKRNDNPALIRVISDNIRPEPTFDAFLNISAGENILRYLRGHGYRIPVLIYTGSSVRQTIYVKKYEMAGSTSTFDACLQYINAFGAGQQDDVRRLTFMM